MNTSISKSRLWATVFLLSLGHFLIDFMIGIWPVYKTLAELDLAKAGLIAALCGFMGEGLQIVFGTLSDKGWRKIFIFGGLLATIGSVFMAYTQNYFLLFTLYLVTTLGSGAFHPSAAGLLGSLSTTQKGLMMTIFGAGGALGLATSQIIYSESYFALENHIFLLAAPTILMAIIIARYHLAETHQTSVSSKKKFNFTAFGKFLKNKNLRNLYISGVCNQATAWAIIFLLPDILTSRGLDDWICFGGGHLFYILGGALIMIPTGFLADKYSFKNVIVGASMIGLVALYLFLWMPEIPIAAMLMLLFVMGGAIGAIQPIALALGSHLVPKQSSTVSAFLMGFVWCVSEFIGPGGGGLLTKCFDENAPAKALAVIGFALVINVAVALQLPQQATAQEETEFA